MNNKFFKITNRYEIHNGYAYHDGLNILQQRFNDDPNDSCCEGGFYFTTLEYIDKFYGFGVNLREVTLPIDHSDFEMIQDPSGDKWRANKIILGKKYSLYNPKTYKYFGLDISDNMYIIDFACAEGNIKFLQEFLDTNISLKFSQKTINSASANGHIAVLQFWKDNGKKFLYDESAMDLASRNGHVHILQWWKESGLPLKYTNRSINMASGVGHIAILDWWKNSGLKLKYSNVAIEFAAANDLHRTIKWWKQSGL